MITISHLDKYFGAQQVLHDVSLTVPEKSVTALIGPSGSGKSTLLRCINLLEVPDAGQIEIGSQQLNFQKNQRFRQTQLRQIRQYTGMIFQNFQLFPHMTVLENVMEGLLTVLRWDKDRARERALELLTKVGMAQKADVWPNTLSGGQQQRVAIARALAPSPQVLLCDEPTSALDPELSIEVVAVLKQLAEEGVTMMIATHDLRLAASIANQVIFIEQGHLIESGTARQIFTQPAHERTVRFVSTLQNTLPLDWEI